MSELLLDAAGRRRSPATLPELQQRASDRAARGASVLSGMEPFGA